MLHRDSRARVPVWCRFWGVHMWYRVAPPESQLLPLAVGVREAFLSVLTPLLATGDSERV